MTNRFLATDKIRVLHCIPALGGGGAEQQFRNYLVSTQSPCLTHAVFAWKTGAFENDIRQRAYPIFWGTATKFQPWKVLRELQRAAREWKPDLIQTWMPQMDVIAGLMTSRLKVPLIGSERSSRELYESASATRGRWFNFMRPWVFRHRVCAVVANSQGGAAYWTENQALSAPVYVIPNGLDLEGIEAVPPADLQTLSLPQGVPLLIMVARLVPIKRLELILEAVAELGEHGNDCCLLFCGAGPSLETLQQTSAQFGLEKRTFFLGHRPDRISLMKAADIFCTASEIEGIPNAVLEAMACGLPIIASDITAHCDVLEPGGAGLLFKSGSASELAQWLAKALDSAALRSELGQKASTASKQYSLARMCRAYDDLYESLGKRTR